MSIGNYNLFSIFVLLFYLIIEGKTIMQDKTFNVFIQTTMSEISKLKNKSEIVEKSLLTIKEIVPSDAIHIFAIDKEANHIKSMHEDLSYSLEMKGIISECYNSHQPLGMEVK